MPAMPDSLWAATALPGPECPPPAQKNDCRRLCDDCTDA